MTVSPKLCAAWKTSVTCGVIEVTLRAYVRCHVPESDELRVSAFNGNNMCCDCVLTCVPWRLCEKAAWALMPTGHCL